MYYCEEEESLYKRERQLFKAWFSASIQLSCLKKVYNAVYLKEFYFTKQGLYKLKEEELKVLSIRVVASSGLLVVPLLPLVDPFVFNSFFSLLPDLLSYNTP